MGKYLFCDSQSEEECKKSQQDLRQRRAKMLLKGQQGNHPSKVACALHDFFLDQKYLIFET